MVKQYVLRFKSDVRIGRVQRFERFVGPFDHAVFRFADPNSRVVEFLVGFIFTLRVANLGLKIKKDYNSVANSIFFLEIV